MMQQGNNTYIISDGIVRTYIILLSFNLVHLKTIRDRGKVQRRRQFEIDKTKKGKKKNSWNVFSGWMKWISRSLSSIVCVLCVYICVNTFYASI